MALVAPPWFEIPPDGYGGIEQMIGDLANGLIARGHEVVLLAAGEDHTDATMVPTFKSPPDGLGTLDGARAELLHAARVAEELDGLDVDLVHDHTFAGPLLAPGRDAPTVVTVHGPVDDATAEFYASVPDLSLVALSDAQRRAHPSLPWVGTVHNGIDVEEHPFREKKEDFFLFLGRMNPEKGADEAIRIAKATGTELVIAAKCDEPDEQRYFAEHVEPLLDDRARFIGAVGTEEKRELLSAALALLFPIQWEEPFGLVMVEALACGTPVVATRRGSVPEVLEHGETGFIADDLDGLVEGARRVGELDPRICREHARQRFDTSVMAGGYEAVYHRLLDAQR